MTDMTRRALIRAYCTARRINTLVHFTRLENLAGILIHGLLPRSVLEGRLGPVLFNDELRTDGRKDAVCLSVSFPNYKMFYKYRMADQTASWAVLLIRADVLWQEDCAFCWVNAASSAISGLPLADLKDSSSLAMMFSDQCQLSGVNRTTCAIPDWFPTNPQAEVLAFSPVSPTYFTAVYFQNLGVKSKFLPPKGTHLAVDLKPDYFKWRSDFKAWMGVSEPS